MCDVGALCAVCKTVYGAACTAPYTRGCKADCVRAGASGGRGMECTAGGVYLIGSVCSRQCVGGWCVCAGAAGVQWDCTAGALHLMS